MMHFIHRCLRCRWDSRVRCMEERERMEGIRWFHCRLRGRDRGCYIIPRFQTWIWMW